MSRASKGTFNFMHICILYIILFKSINIASKRFTNDWLLAILYIIIKIHTNIISDNMHITVILKK